MGYRFYTADVFTHRPFGGNQLAVFPEAAGLSDAQMQAIAREFNLSETAFVFPPDSPENTRRLRFFTPGIELPFAGHPTLGTAFVLASVGEIAVEDGATEITFEEGVGPVKVSIFAENGRPVFTRLTAAQRPVAGPPPPEADEIVALLSLKPDDLYEAHHTPQPVSCGVPFLIVPVRSLDAVRRAAVNLEVWERCLASFWAPHIYVFSYETEQPDAQVHARMFAPAMGIREDPATGAAASAMGGYLGARQPDPSGTFRWTIEQGSEMGRPSLLEVEADKLNNEIVAVRVGGASVMISEGTLLAV